MWEEQQQALTWSDSSVGTLCSWCPLFPEAREKGTGSLSFLKPASPLSSGICPCQEPWNVILMISSLSSIFLCSLSNMSKFIYISEKSGDTPERGGTSAQQNLQIHSLPGIFIFCDLSGSHIPYGLTLYLNYIYFSKCNSIKPNVGTEKKCRRLSGL